MPSYSLRLFDSGLTFLDALPELSADLIILDQHMPGLSGLQTLRAVKQQPHCRSQPVVMMSAAASPSEIISFYEAGAIRYLAKQADVTPLKDSLLLACQLASKLG
jgi:CheY-like chemotaxis protein